MNFTKYITFGLIIFLCLSSIKKENKVLPFKCVNSKDINLININWKIESIFIQDYNIKRYYNIKKYQKRIKIKNNYFYLDNKKMNKINKNEVNINFLDSLSGVYCFKGILSDENLFLKGVIKDYKKDIIISITFYNEKRGSDINF